MDEGTNGCFPYSSLEKMVRFDSYPIVSVTYHSIHSIHSVSIIRSNYKRLSVNGN